MQMFAKGQVLEEAIGMSNCMMWNISDGHAWMAVHVDGKSIDRYRLGGHYDFACVPIRDVLFFCARYGQHGYVNWMSAPFSPHLAEDRKYGLYEPGKGMPLSVLLVRTDDGMIVDMDFMVLGNDFSNTVSRLSSELLRQKFDPEAYNRTIQAVYQKIPTDEELAAQAKIRYSID